MARVSRGNPSAGLRLRANDFCSAISACAGRPEVAGEKDRKDIMVPPPFEFPLALPPSPLFVSLSLSSFLALFLLSPFSFCYEALCPWRSPFSLIPVVFSSSSFFFRFGRAVVFHCGYLHNKRRKTLAHDSTENFTAHVACTHELPAEVRSGPRLGYQDQKTTISSPTRTRPGSHHFSV